MTAESKLAQDARECGERIGGLLAQITLKHGEQIAHPDALIAVMQAVMRLSDRPWSCGVAAAIPSGYTRYLDSPAYQRRELRVVNEADSPEGDGE